MNKRFAGASTFAVMLASLAILAPAGQAATRTVYAGYDAGHGVFKQLDTNSFFRSRVTVHVGDSVSWQFRGFHDVAFLGGTKRPDLIVPNLAAPIVGANDASGVPYWFNGQPNLDINPQIAFPAGGKTFAKGKFFGSGLPLGSGAPPPYKLKFNTPGTFTYYCLVHPGMAGTVRVVGKRTHIPSAAQNLSAAKHQLAALVAVAKSRNAAKPLAGATVEAGRSTSEFSIEKFFPSSITVKVGEPVTFTMAKDSAAEPHTITFGPPSVTGPVATSFITPVTPAGGGAPEIRLDPRDAYPTSVPGPTPVAYDLTNHGDGLENLGVLDAVAASPQPVSAQITFKSPGTYHYICVIHEGMEGVVTVTP